MKKHISVIDIHSIPLAYESLYHHQSHLTREDEILHWEWENVSPSLSQSLLHLSC